MWKPEVLCDMSLLWRWVTRILVYMSRQSLWSADFLFEREKQPLGRNSAYFHAEQPLTVPPPPFNGGVTLNWHCSEDVKTGSELPRVTVMAIVGTSRPTCGNGMASVASMAGRLPVSQLEATPRRNSAYFHVSVSL